MLEKFKTFRWRDFFVFGGIPAVVSAISGYAIAYGVTVGEALGLIGVSLSFWAVYALQLLLRWKYIQKIAFISKHKIAVLNNQFSVSKEAFEAIVDSTISDWKAASGFDGAKAVEGLFVIWQAYPVETHRKLKLAGYTVGDHVVVGHKSDLSQTALRHEIGHVIHKAWTGKADNSLSHEFMAKHGLL